jgi:hypothetical protein
MPVDRAEIRRKGASGELKSLAGRGNCEGRDVPTALRLSGDAPAGAPDYSVAVIGRRRSCRTLSALATRRAPWRARGQIGVARNIRQAVPGIAALRIVLGDDVVRLSPIEGQAPEAEYQEQVDKAQEITKHRTHLSLSMRPHRTARRTIRVGLSLHTPSVTSRIASIPGPERRAGVITSGHRILSLHTNTGRVAG